MGLLLLSFLFRSLTFFYSMIDFDESTYLLIGKEMLKGAVLYVDYIDTKPPGIFIIYGLIDFLTGNGIVFSRIIACVLVAATAFLLYKLKLALAGNRSIAVLAAVLYVVLVSSYRFGYAANTEIFFNFFTVWSFLVLFNAGKNLQFLWGGILAGFGFVIKYVVAFDFTSYWLFFFYLMLIGQGKVFFKGVLSAFVSLVGFLLPALVVLTCYLLSGHINEMLEMNFRFFSNYHNTSMTGQFLQMLLDIHLKYLPAFILFYFVLIINAFNLKRTPGNFLGLIWALLVLLSIVLQQKPYTHYFTQLFPVMAFVISDFFIYPTRLGNYLLKFRSRALTIIFSLLWAISLINQSYYIFRPDYPRLVASYLKKQLNGGDKVFVYNYNSIVYYLIGQPPLSKYVHQTLLIYTYHLESLGINADRELDSVFKENPRFIVTRNNPSFHSSAGFFITNYTIDTVFNDEINVFKRNTH